MLKKDTPLQEFLSMFLCVIKFLIKLVLLYGVIQVNAGAGCGQ